MSIEIIKMIINKLINIFLLFIMINLLGCHSENLEELDAFMNKVKSQSVEKIEILPDVEPYENFTYSAMNLRSPFARPEFERDAANGASNNGLHPDMNRRKEVLENFPLDGLRMLGTLEKNGKRWAIVKDSDATIYRVTLGNYIGQNYGHIDSVQEDSIKITEIIPDGRGGWIERKASLALIAQ